MFVFHRPTPTGTGTSPRHVPPSAAARRDGSTYALVEFGMPSEKLWKSDGGIHVSAARPAEPAVTSAHVIAPRGAPPSRRADHHRHATTSGSEPPSTAPARLVHASSASAIVPAVQRGRTGPRLVSSTTSRSTPSPYERVITEY